MPARINGKVVGLRATTKPKPDRRVRFDPDRIQAEVDQHNVNAMEFDERAAYERKKAREKMQLKAEVIRLKKEHDAVEPKIIASTLNEPIDDGSD